MATLPVEGMDTNRVAIVTGGARGVGLEITRTLAGRGFAVVLSYAVDQAAAEAAVEEVLAADGVALAVRADVADELDVARLFRETTEAFAEIDVVAHAATRLALGQDEALGGSDAQQWTDMQGAFVVNQQASRQVRRGGTIVNVCVDQLFCPTSATGTGSNGAIGVMTRALARELHEQDVTINAVAFRPDAPEAPTAVAAIVGFLVSRDARNLSGHVIHVDGNAA
jgi:3-oxoacyl-[acyl-carrier protein] reductase